MKYVLVNGRTPRPSTRCGMCRVPIADGYVRDIATGLSYCNHRCWVDRPHAIVPYVQKRSAATLHH
jgi:hypothetical protein